MAARIAKSLDKLRAQINAAFPERSKISDGWIGDTAHASRKSDHNPNSADVVQALDITHDPGQGFDSWKFADVLRQNKDPRIKYVISNGRIFSSSSTPWEWRTYTGSNKHAHHIHISVNDDPSLYDDDAPWALTAGGAITPRPPAVVVPGVTPAMRTSMAKKIIGYEAKRDADGNLAVHSPGDGSHEIAGISSTSNPQTYQKLRQLLQAGRYAAAESEAEDFVIKYTSAGAEWTTDPGVEFYLRDSIYNRGPVGGAKILQMAVGATPDGEVGPTTRALRDRLSPDVLLTKLRSAREAYEIEKYGKRANIWQGMVNRWNKALADAHSFRSAKPEKPPVVPEPVKQGGIAALLLAIGAALSWFFQNIFPLVLIAIIGISVGAIIWKARKNRRQ